MCIITIDCGASFIKASKFKEDRIIATITEKTPKDRDEKKIEKSLANIRDIIDRFSIGEEEVLIGFSNEMHGFLLADADGKPITGYISWQDESAYESYGDSNYLEYLRGIIDKETILETGMPLKVGLPSVNLFYVLNNQLADYEGEAYFYTLGDYYIRALSGKQPFCHETNAAGTGLFNLVKREFGKELIDIVCSNSSCKVVFPEIYRGQKAILKENGKVKEYYYPALGDQQAALLGAGVRDKKDLSLNFGTGAQISQVIECLSLSEDYQNRPYFDDKYIKTIPHIPSGRALNVYFRLVKDILDGFVEAEDEKVWEHINEEARKNQKERVKVDLSFFTNAVTDRIKGSISEISEDSLSLGNLFDSIYKQLSNNILTIIDRLKVAPYDRIIISGGILAKNTYLREMVLEDLDTKAQVLISENETALGIHHFVKENS